MRAFAETLATGHQPQAAPRVPQPACVACGDASDAELCAACVALAARAHLTPADPDARSVEVRLNLIGLRETQAAQDSLRDDALHWSADPTGWWRDAKGVNHPREWSGFFHGHVLARVRVNRDGRFTAHVWNAAAAEFQLFGGSTRTRQAAARLATDAVSDRGVAEMVRDVEAREAAEHVARAATGWVVYDSV